MTRLIWALALIFTGITFVVAGLVLAKVRVVRVTFEPVAVREVTWPDGVTWAGGAW